METLIPENDSQELWELHGRVSAVLTYVKMNAYADPEVIAAMLFGDKINLSEESKEGDSNVDRM